MTLEYLCVFAGSGDGAHPDYVATADALGGQLAKWGTTLVYGGASVGLMGAVANGVLSAGGEAIGVMPESLVAQGLAHEGLTELRVVGSMHERKAEMAELADAFLALPGGLGTFEELLEMATWSQLGIHAKPCGVLNVRGYFDLLMGQLEGAVAEAFLSSDHREIVLSDHDSERLLGQLCGWTPPAPKRSRPYGIAQ